MNITVEVLRAGTGCSTLRAAKWAPHIQKACGTFFINTPERLAAFLSQIGHESGRLVYTREIWGATPAQVRYEGRKDLGNTEPGDGKRFCGRGLIQTTGRANYAATTAGLRKILKNVPDFVTNPTLLEEAEWAAMSAAWYWYSKGLNELADTGDYRRITLRINGGTNGMEDRLALWKNAKRALGVKP